MPLDPVIIDALINPRFNPPALVEQLRMLPFARPLSVWVEELEADFLRDQQAREESLRTLWQLTSEQTFKQDNPDAFSSIIASFERHARDISRKLEALEKQIRSAQKDDPKRDRNIDERILSVARADLESRIDTAVWWRALQARTWPEEVGEPLATGDEVLDFLGAKHA